MSSAGTTHHTARVHHSQPDLQQRATYAPGLFFNGGTIEPELESIISAYQTFRAQAQKEDFKGASITCKIKYHRSRKSLLPKDIGEKLLRSLSDIRKRLHRPFKVSETEKQAVSSISQAHCTEPDMQPSFARHIPQEIQGDVPFHYSSYATVPSMTTATTTSRVEAPGDDRRRPRAPLFSEFEHMAHGTEIDAVHELQGNLSCQSGAHHGLSSTKPSPSNNGSQTKIRLPRTTRDSSTSTTFISPMSSMYEDSTSGLQSSRQFSNTSMVSAFTPATSISLQDVHDRPQSLYGLPTLVIDTSRLLVPQELFLEGPLTDSPAEDMVLDLKAPFTERGTHEPSLVDCIGMDSQSSSYHSFPSLQETHEVMPPPPYQLDSPSLNMQTHGHLWMATAYAATNEGESKQPGSDTSSDSIGEACRQYANGMSERNPSVIVTYLEDAFDLAVGYWHEKVDTVDLPSPVTLQTAFPESPTIEAALIALQALLSAQEDLMPDENEQTLTPHGLISLVFLSFSLLCLAIPKGHRLTSAVSSLYRCAKSWLGRLPISKETSDLEQLIDKLWLLAEHQNGDWDAFVANPGILYESTMPYGSEVASECILSEVSLIFIQCESRAPLFVLGIIS